MLTARLQQRVPSAVAVATGYITDHQLTFHKIGKDGSGKGTLEHHRDDRVYGVVHQMHPDELGSLNKAESLGIGYEHCRVTVQSSLGERKILTYQAIQTELGLMPYCWYRDLVVQGAISHRLPPTYIEALAAQPFIQDPDLERRQHHHSLLDATSTL